MRLTKNNIRFVKELIHKGIVYEYVVVMKSGYVSDTRIFLETDSGGKSTGKPYDKTNLPKSVLAFIDGHSRVQFDCIDKDYEIYIYE